MPNGQTDIVTPWAPVGAKNAQLLGLRVMVMIPCPTTNNTFLMWSIIKGTFTLIVYEILRSKSWHVRKAHRHTIRKIITDLSKYQLLSPEVHIWPDNSHHYNRHQPVAALTDYKLAMLLMLLIVYRRPNQDISVNSSHVPSLTDFNRLTNFIAANIHG